jgi:hypothetical protein
MKIHEGMEVSPTIIISNRWSVARFKPMPLYSMGRNSQNHFDRRLGGVQSRSGLCGDKKTHFLLPGIKLLFLAHQVTLPTEYILNLLVIFLLNVTIPSVF